MALILAVQPDLVQAFTLHRALRTWADDAELVTVDSADDALAAIDREKPDLILLHTFISPGDEARIVGHLRSLPEGDHLQTLMLPQLRCASNGARHRPGRFLGVLNWRASAPGNADCEPRVFAEEVAKYLSRLHATT